jgi:hypothetical protein
MVRSLTWMGGGPGQGPRYAPAPCAVFVPCEKWNAVLPNGRGSRFDVRERAQGWVDGHTTRGQPRPLPRGGCLLGAKLALNGHAGRVDSAPGTTSGCCGGGRGARLGAVRQLRAPGSRRACAPRRAVTPNAAPLGRAAASSRAPPPLRLRAAAHSPTPRSPPRPPGTSLWRTVRRAPSSPSTCAAAPTSAACTPWAATSSRSTRDRGRRCGPGWRAR